MTPPTGQDFGLDSGQDSIFEGGHYLRFRDDFRMCYVRLLLPLFSSAYKICIFNIYMNVNKYTYVYTSHTSQCSQAHSKRTTTASPQNRVVSGVVTGVETGVETDCRWLWP